MKKIAFGLLLLASCALTVVPAIPDTPKLPYMVAQVFPTTSATPPFSCQFAGFNQYNNLINSGIGCATPGPGSTGYPTLSCGGLVTCSPNSGPTPSIFVPSPHPSSSGCAMLSIAWPLVSLDSSSCAGATYPTLNCTGLATCAPVGGPTPGIYVPSPTASSTGCGVLSWATPFQINGNFSSCSAQATPSPSATSTTTAGPPSAVWSGSWPYELQVFFPAGGGGGPVCEPTAAPITTLCLQSPGVVATPSPFIQGGGVAFSGPLFIGPSPFCWNVGDFGPNCTPAPSPTPVVAMYIKAACEGETWTAIGSGIKTNVSGVYGNQLMVGCPGWATGQVYFVIGSNVAGDENGDIGVYAAAHIGTYVESNDGFEIPLGSTTGAICTYENAGSGVGTGVQITSLGTGTCPLTLTNLSANSYVCDNASLQLVTCGGASRGQAACTLSGTSCAATATVPASAVCSASYDDVATSVTPLTDLKPITLDVTSTTLTINMYTTTSLSGTLAADYVCN
jgi:hypothetical protein